MKGFTLIEAMVTLIILSVGLLALEKFYISVIDSQQVAQERLMATHLAEQMMEYWQHDANDYVPNISSGCALSDRTSAPAYPVSVTCTHSLLSVTYTIWSNTSQAQAPLPTNPNNGGAPLVAANGGAFSIRGMQAVVVDTPTTHNSVTPMLKVVKVSWSHKGNAQVPVVLTHISRLQ